MRNAIALQNSEQAQPLMPVFFISKNAYFLDVFSLK